MNFAPFQIVIDTREQLPFKFDECRIERKKCFVWTVRRTLQTGDYSVAGLENTVCVERKSLQDLYQTLTAGRERFFNELERIKEFKAAMLVIEADWKQIADPERFDPLFHSQASPNSIIGTLVSIAGHYPNLKINATGNRKNAEKETLKFLTHFYKQNIK